MKDFVRRASWSLWDWVAFVAVCAFVVILALPSRIFLNPTAVSIDQYEVTVTREFPLSPPLGRPFVQYVETVRSLETSEHCQDDNGQGFRYSDDENGVGRWEIQSWAARCMTGSYHWRATWWVKLFGVIRLRPVEMDTIVLK